MKPRWAYAATRAYLPSLTVVDHTSNEINCLVISVNGHVHGYRHNAYVCVTECVTRRDSDHKYRFTPLERTDVRIYGQADLVRALRNYKAVSC